MDSANSTRAELGELGGRYTHIRVGPGMVLDDVRVPWKGVDDGYDDVEDDGEEVPLAEDRAQDEGEERGDRDRVDDVAFY